MQKRPDLSIPAAERRSYAEKRLREQRQEVEPKRYGFKGVLVKPFDAAKLHAMISQVMGAM